MQNKVVVSTVMVLLVVALQWLDPELFDEITSAHATSETVFSHDSGMSFSQAKRFLQQDVHAPGEQDYYCGCDIFAVGKRWQLDLASCGYEVRHNQQRANRIEWEHVVPASEFGQQRACWREGGRANCTANDPVFSMMEGDPHNLIPVVGEVNGDRGNLRFGMIANHDGEGYGQCGSRVDFKARVFMPRAEVRGDVARIYLYFQDRYGLALSRQREQLYNAWSRLDPVDERECVRNQRIAERTGISNTFIASACTGHVEQLARH